MIDRHDSIIVRKISHFLIPFIHVFAVYVLFHGHYSPGGGFQAGVLIGAAIILKVLVESKADITKLSIASELKVACAGLVLYALPGILPVFYGRNLFDYGAIAFLADYEPMRRYWSILIAEAGVTLVVAMTLVLIFHILALAPNLKRSGS